MKPGAVFPAKGLGAEGGTTDGDKAIRAIKAMAKHSIDTAALDEAGAIDGSRPLEQVADACGYAWGSTNVQMTEDLSHFKVLLMVGKCFTPAQQAWPPLVLEGFAQLAGKRAQRKILGPMKSLNWTDHATFTKQQVTDPAELDCKLLRWTSEITADGSEIRSLAGRAARLGDGTSRNPSDRDALLEQRSKDLQGLIGQVRGFNLDEFLSDYEEPGTAIPWALGDHGWVASKKTEPQKGRSLPSGQRGGSPPAAGAVGFYTDPFAGTPSPQSGPSAADQLAREGVKPKLKVLYAADYVPSTARIERTAALVRELSLILPTYEIRLGLAQGPFEDVDGVASHFDKESFQGKTVSKQSLAMCRSSSSEGTRPCTLRRLSLAMGKVRLLPSATDSRVCWRQQWHLGMCRGPKPKRWLRRGATSLASWQ